ncbi:hypothetical protein KC640_02405, partial [Candidatus Dojkabacteria bacterium]|nr:hypothetical protein [Candidatus Dojkabacteria bacterium]
IPVVDSNGQRAAYTAGEVLAVPLLTDSTSQLRIQSTYLTAGSGFSVTFAYAGTFAQQNIYATNGQTWVAIAMLLTFPVIVALAAWQLGRDKAVTFALLLAHFLIVSVSLLKLGGTAISLGMMLALAVSYTIAVGMIYQLVQLSGPELTNRWRLYRNFSIFIFLLCWGLFNLGVLTGLAQEVIGILGVMVVGLLIANLWGFRFLQDR